MINNKCTSEIKAAILLCTYNGEKYIIDQLNSIKDQTFKNWYLYISDDRSSDNTVSIIKSWSEENNFSDKVKIYTGPCSGFASNYLSLTSNNEIEADVFFWADQDDIWLPGKISRAIDLISTNDNGLPVLYCGRTILTDQNNIQFGLSPLQNKFSPSFENALVQSLGGANTMAFNQKAREIISLAYNNIIPSHDWWAYLIVSGNEGCIIYDEIPYLRYRQHDNNIVGSNISLKSKLQRFRLLINGSYKKKIDLNISSLLLNKTILSVNNYNLLKKFIYIRNYKNIFVKIFNINKFKIRRQHKMLTFILTVAFIFNRL